MSIVWFSKYSKAVVLTGGLFMAAGLILMGKYNNFSGGSNVPDVGEVNGKSISLDEFRKQLENYEEQQRAQNPQSMDQFQSVQMRQNLFDYKVQSLLLAEAAKELHLVASGTEMWSYLENNPDPAIQQDTTFQTMGRFDHQKYLRWIHDPANAQHPYLGYMETQLSQTILPEMQLRTLLQSFEFTTNIEVALDDIHKESQVSLVYAQVPLDSIQIADSTITDQDLRNAFQAEPDSFFQPIALARLGMVKVPLLAAPRDTLLALDVATDLRKRLDEGSSFEEIAISYSDDHGSAENGGKLGGLQSRESWVPEFSDVAFNLEAGQVSAPVLSRFGYHIIRCNAIEGKDSSKKVDASHILIRIIPSTETIDSLTKILENVKQQAEKKPLKEIAEKAKLTYTETPYFNKEQNSPLGQGEFVSGMHSFAFAPDLKDQKISDVLQNDQAAYLFERSSSLAPGRHFEMAKDKLRQIVTTHHKQAAAKKILQTAMPTIETWVQGTPAPSQVLIDTTGMVAFQSWVPGLGFDSPNLVTIAKQDTGKWGKIYTTDFSAFTAKLQSKQAPELKHKLDSLQNIPPKDMSQNVNELYKDYMENRKKSSKIKNNLELIYRI